MAIGYRSMCVMVGCACSRQTYKRAVDANKKLSTAARSVWVISRQSALRKRCPLYPQKRTFGDIAIQAMQAPGLIYSPPP